ncbi:MAG TPA: hypothetical protein VHF06_21315, partial [Pseudonocardiaceae bacterium]|nr:hypothetical protein [Pseudonocardiaceae bacterium]
MLGALRRLGWGRLRSASSARRTTVSFASGSSGGCRFSTCKGGAGGLVSGHVRPAGAVFVNKGRMLLLRCSPWLGEHRSDNVIGLAV